MPRMIEREKAFAKANYPVLRQIATELEVEIAEDGRIKLAQKLFDQGIGVPGNLEPLENWILDQIMQAVTTNNIPPKLIVYLNDRIGADIDELDVPTALARRTQIVFNKLSSSVNAANEELGKLKS